jgi:hypothetical protein
MNEICCLLNPLSLLDHFEAIEDPRLDRQKKYPLTNILVYAFVAILSDQQSWYEIEAFSRINLKWFSQYLDVSCGVPSHDTFRRVFSLLDPTTLEKLMILWAEEVRKKHSSETPKIVALDGKALRGVPWKISQEQLYTLNAWDSSEKTCIGQITIGEKTNEITAAPQLLKLLNLKDTVITTDALLTQKEVAKTVIDKGGDYVMALKGLFRNSLIWNCSK